jgi:hypothetical protein
VACRPAAAAAYNAHPTFLDHHVHSVHA